ncbi:dihydropteroate synthase [Capsulimonas corticalis]|uniref:Dihydropteroate synthase n=1 Tax=Capsulimonas corticalis TaxID=2219043 RepID=A0A402CRA9_9BACT|nr:dihydropteroate synthase [Capsulimonas corticalis]BDI28045.1 dihydropteroate synthase [Capsulimonas corticalis]
MGTRTLVMGVLNVTPDSFSDGGQYADPAAAVAHARQMIADGADILDIGGESTRPATFRDSSPLNPEEELRRVLPAITQIASEFPDVLLSIDTYKAAVAEAALDAGASIVNDISALSYDPEMAPLVARRGVPAILMHLPGKPRDVAKARYGDILSDIAAYFFDRIAAVRALGVWPEQLLIDPGLGFGKNTEQNLEILRRLRELQLIGAPMVIGASRKRFIGAVLGTEDPMDRREGTAATVALSIAAGADIVRVHDVREMARVARMSDAIVRPSSE